MIGPDRTIPVIDETDIPVPNVASKTEKAADAPAWNLPNQVTAVRLIVSAVVFVMFELRWYRAALVLFLIAASTDWIDGQLARRYGLVTQLGRILDPLADKIVICGSFIYLAAMQEHSRIAAWMAVIVVARELAVTVIRSFLEQNGKDFSANMPGKLKMVFQCAAVVAALYLLHMRTTATVPSFLPSLVTGLAWLAVLSTIYSGIIYVFAAARLVREL